MKDRILLHLNNIIVAEYVEAIIDLGVKIIFYIKIYWSPKRKDLIPLIFGFNSSEISNIDLKNTLL